MSEREAEGIAFEIEHYVPQEHPDGPALANEYVNLFWVCSVCNGNKSDYFPSPERLALCYRFYRPDWDNFADTFSVAEFRLEPLSLVGEFSIRMLMLNHGGLKRLREVRARMTADANTIAQGLLSLTNRALDRVSPAERLIFRNFRDAIAGAFADLEAFANTDDAIRQVLRSPLLDRDPDHARQLADRLAYSATIGAPRSRTRPR